MTAEPRWSDWYRTPHERHGPYFVRIALGVVDGQTEAVAVDLRGVRPSDLPDGVMPESSLGPRAVTTKTIRDLAMRRLVRQETARFFVGLDLPSSIWTEPDPDNPNEVVVRSGPNPPPRPPEFVRAGEAAQRELADSPTRGHGLAHYQQVRDVFLEAHANGKPAQKAIADHFGVTKTTAAAWIHRCRYQFDPPLLPRPRSQKAPETNETEDNQ